MDYILVSISIQENEKLPWIYHFLVCLGFYMLYIIIFDTFSANQAQNVCVR